LEIARPASGCTLRTIQRDNSVVHDVVIAPSKVSSAVPFANPGQRMEERDVRPVAVTTLAVAMMFGTQARAELSTECSTNRFCYCVDVDLEKTIATRVDEIRARIAAQRQQGKAIGYLSIPISTVAGSHFGVNTKVAARTKERVEERFGARSVWLLNTAAKEFSLPNAASGADYMLMWTRVLEGDDGLGGNFDFVYFTGPSDFAEFFSLDGYADMAKLNAYYDRLAKTGIRKVDRADFRNYYGLRASVSFSYGSHDEWNIVRTINGKRRARKDEAGGYSVARQIAVLFNGAGVAPGLFEPPATAGNEGKCPVQK
jgi:hypothetical protein